MYQSHADIIKAWPGDLPAFAADHNVEYETAKKYRYRGIPAYRWNDTVRLAKLRKVKGVTHDVLEALSPVRRGRGRSKIASLHVA